MVGTGSIIAMCITLMIALILPVAILIVYALKNKGQGVVAAWFLGAAGFFVMQIIIRTPILSVLGMNKAFNDFAADNYLVYVVILAFTAGLFEVVGRYAVAKLLKNKLSCKMGIAAGLGHGGIEAMVLIGMTYINNILYAFMINSGLMDTVIEQSAVMGTDAVQQLNTVVDALVETPSYLFALAGYERLLTMICQVAMTLIVFHYVSKKQDVKGIGLCLVFHTLLDGVSGLLSGLATPYLGSVISTNVSYALVYVFMTVAAVVSCIVICKVKKEWKTDGNS